MATLDQIHAVRPVKSITVLTDNPYNVRIMLEFVNGGAFGWCSGATLQEAIQNLDKSSLLNDMVNSGGHSKAT